MKNMKALLIRLALSGELALCATATSAQSWQTVDDYQFGAGSTLGGLAVAPNGTIFAAGEGDDTLGHALVRASVDGGLTWSAPLDDFTNGGAFDAGYDMITCDSAGNVYAAGFYIDDPTGNTNYWFVRRSTDGGASWSTTDDYQDGSDLTLPKAMTTDGAGNVYVAGYAQTLGWIIRKGVGGTNFIIVDTLPSPSSSDGAAAIYVHPTVGVFAAGTGPISITTDKRGRVTTTYGWVVRLSTDGGATWSTVDKFALSSGYSASGKGIASDALGNLYVVGYSQSLAGKYPRQTVSDNWVVRKSSNGGASWSTVDTFQLPSGVNGEPTSIVADSFGNLFVAGYLNASDGVHWLVRENPGGTGTWQTVDDFKYIGGATAKAMAADASGHVFVGGDGWSNTDNIYHWLVRKR